MSTLSWVVIFVNPNIWDIHSLKLTANASDNWPFTPKGNDHLPTIIFHGSNLLLVLRRILGCPAGT